MSKRWLIRVGTEIFTYNNSNTTIRKILDNYTGLTDEHFTSEGADSPPSTLILNSLANPRILCSGSELLSKAVVKAEAHPQYVEMRDSVVLNNPDILGFSGVFFEGIGDIKACVTFDDGGSYYYHDGESWCKSSDRRGTSIVKLNALNQNDWITLHNLVGHFTKYRWCFILNYINGSNAILKRITLNYNIRVGG